MVTFMHPQLTPEPHIHHIKSIYVSMVTYMGINSDLVTSGKSYVVLKFIAAILNNSICQSMLQQIIQQHDMMYTIVHGG